MKVQDSLISECKILTPCVYNDNRGSFLESWNDMAYKNEGISVEFVQDNIIESSKGTLRGVHTQLKYPQAKLVSCVKGSIFDVVVDCRFESPTFGVWFGTILSQKDHKQLFIPERVAHGFYTIDDAIIFMKVSTHYTPGDEIGFKWDDKSIDIDWPLDRESEPILAEKDKNWGNFDEMMNILDKYRI